MNKDNFEDRIKNGDPVVTSGYSTTKNQKKTPVHHFPAFRTGAAAAVAGMWEWSNGKLAN